MDNKLNILVIATGYPSRLLKTITDRGHEYTLAKPHDFDIYLSDNIKGFDALYLNGNKIAVSKYDAVISRVGENREFASKILRQLQSNLGLFCVQSGTSINICADKFECAQIMSRNKIKVPKQFYSMNPESARLMTEKLGGLPIILKELSGSKGKGLILLESPLQTNMTLQSYLGGARRIILQEYLQNGNIDERHIVCDGKVVSSMKRIAPKDDVRANLSLNGKGEKIEVDAETEKMCVDAVQAIDGLNFAGVDIMKKVENGEEKRYLIEINSNPGELIIDITGHNHYEDLLDFVERNCHGKRKPVTDENPEESQGADAPGKIEIPGTTQDPERKPIEDPDEQESARQSCREFMKKFYS